MGGVLVWIWPFGGLERLVAVWLCVCPLWPGCVLFFL